jgi:hypothetical protein
MFLFGSNLIKKYFPDFRNPVDVDFVTNNITEYNTEYFNIIKKETELHFLPLAPNREMTPDELYTLKVSHAIYDIHWQKTMSDIRFLQNKNCKIIKPFLEELREYWKTIHQTKRCEFDDDDSLDFFNDKVDRKIPHDELHKIFNPNPSYKLIVQSVTPDEDKFDKLSILDKNKICFEEAYVIAIERFFDKLPFRIAYNKSQQALVTRLHPIWLADWVILNWNKTFWTTRVNYYEIFEKKLKNNERKI